MSDATFVYSISDPALKQSLDKSLVCDAVNQLSQPSACAGKSRSCSSVTKGPTNASIASPTNVSTTDRPDGKTTSDRSNINHRYNHGICGTRCYIGIGAGCGGAVLLILVVAVIVKTRKNAVNTLVTYNFESLHV